MKQRLRFHIHERLRRIHYIKTELELKIHNSLLKNKYVSRTVSLLANVSSQRQQPAKYAISRHRILCPLNSSFRLVNRSFRLSRFSLNSLARTNNISGLLRRGW
jgi:ribosomal protein S14